MLMHPKKTAEELLHTIHNNSIDQLGRQPTRGKRILDLVLTNNKSIVKEVEVIAGLSDHDAVKTVMKKEDWDKGQQEATQESISSHKG